MATKAKGKQQASDEPAKKRRGLKKLLIPVVALALGVVVGPKLLGGGAASGEPATESTTSTTTPGPVVTLEPITLNLADGHLLKVGLALQISAAWLDEHGQMTGTEEPALTDPTRGYARALDAAIGAFSSRTMSELMEASGREGVRSELAARLGELYGGEIETVYLYEFVMQ